MFDLPGLILFLVATVTINITPGPDMLYVTARSLGQGTKAGLVSALGIGAGCLVHTVAAAIGLSALLLSSAFAFKVIKYLGAFYLCYLGVKMLVSGRGSQDLRNLPRADFFRVFRQGVITNVFNPKVALFFLAFLPQFVDQSKGQVMLQLIILGSIFVISGTFWNGMVAILAGSLGSNLKEKAGFWHLQRWFTGGVLLVLGARLALSSEGDWADFRK